MIHIIIAGFKGKMGSTCLDMVLNQPDFQLVGLLDHFATEQTVQLDSVNGSIEVPVFHQKEAIIGRVSADVWIDFTQPASAVENTTFALQHHIRPVVGTTGFSEEHIQTLQTLAKTYNIGGLIAPNFAIGAVLMMQFAKKAANYFPDVDIIELHHNQKLDAPSGTALKTAEMIYEVRGEHQTGHPDEKESIVGALGADYHGIHIHSVRLPGLVAHQQVQFGARGEGLTIRHDSFDRSSFMNGVALGCRKVMELDELIYGLEHIL